MNTERLLTEVTNKLLTPEQAAELLQVSKRTMYQWLRNGEIPSERIGDRLIRVRESDVLSPDARIYFEQGCKLAQDPETVFRAEVLFNKAIAINSHYWLAYFELGRMFYTWGHYHQAVEPMKRGIALNPSFPAYMNLGMNCNRGWMHKEAEIALGKAVELQPNSATAQYELGVSIMMSAFSERERMPEAVEHFRKSLENDPNHELSAYFLGHALVLHLQDYRGALSFSEEIEQTFPDTAKHIRFLVELNAR